MTAAASGCGMAQRPSPCASNTAAYILDEATRSIYLTDSVEGLTIDGVIL